MPTISEAISSISSILLIIVFIQLKKSDQELKQLRQEVREIKKEAQRLEKELNKKIEQLERWEKKLERWEKKLERSEKKLERLELEVEQLKSQQAEWDDKISKEFEQIKAELREMKGILGNLMLVHIKQMGPIFESLLIKGTCSMLKWHGEGLYSWEVKLSVGQLNRLNDELDLVPRDQVVQKMQDLVQNYPIGPPVLTPCTHYPLTTPSFLRSEIPQGRSIVGNAGIIDDDFREKLLNLYSTIVNDRNVRCHQGMAGEIAQFFQLVESHQTISGMKYAFKDFHRCYSLLFGFSWLKYKYLHDEGDPKGKQVLTNSGSLETIVGEDEDEEPDKKEDC